MDEAGGTTGRLAIVATPIGNLGDVSERVRQTLAEADAVLAEDTRRTRGLLEHLGLAGKRLERFDAHVEAKAVGEVLARLVAGERLALVSDAGTPTVSDPGAALVRAAVERGVAVAPIPGPSAVVSALAVCGFAAERFRFFGFLPRGGSARREAVAAVVDTPEVVVLFEAPSRLAATLRDLADRQGGREAMVARELTKLHEELVYGTVRSLAERDGWRGEITLVLGPAPIESEVVDVDARIAALVAEGLRHKDVARALALETGMSSSEAYRRVLDHAKRSREEDP